MSDTPRIDRIEKMADSIADFAEMVRPLEQELAEANEACHKASLDALYMRDDFLKKITQLERQLAEAGEDKARLNLLEDAYAIQTPKTRTDDVWCVVTERPYYARRLRAAIDAARDRKAHP